MDSDNKLFEAFKGLAGRIHDAEVARVQCAVDRLLRAGSVGLAEPGGLQPCGQKHPHPLEIQAGQNESTPGWPRKCV